MLCNGSTCTCPVCGKSVLSMDVPEGGSVSHLCKGKPGLGDMVAAGLSAIGITKERVSAAVGGDCGCAKRQEQLNAIGRRIGIG